MRSAVPGRVCIAVLACCACAAVGCAPPTPSNEASAAKSVRIHGPTECGSCHLPQTEHYLETGHARTLSLAQGPEFLQRFAPRSVELDFHGRKHELTLRQQQGQVFVGSERFPSGLPIEWLFGSGRHAQTPVTVHVNPNSRETESIQFFTTWYRDHGIGRTPGLESLLGDESVSTVGVPTDFGGTVRCFRCHVSDLPFDQTIVHINQIVAGVMCSRCHEGLEAHVDDSAELPTSRFNDTPLAAVEACGECHRMGDEALLLMAPNPLINTARFAPVGIKKSACFLQQRPDQRFDCLTCHDPHLPMSDEPAFYNAKCSQCHVPSELPTACMTPGTLGEGCVGCHMPSVVAEGWLSFTQHWIRRPDTALENAATPLLEESSESANK